MAIEDKSFEALMQRTGLSLPAETVAELRGIFAHLEAMTARNGAPRERAAEPATTFALAAPEDAR